MAMDWERLLCETRIRDLKNGLESDGDHRSEFDRDYDRIIFSSTLRRLKDKTQVFPLDPNDFVRTRLTHSLEVASIAKGLMALIIEKLKEDKGVDLHHLESKLVTVASTAALVHDLGNPPFGHFGEDSIQSWFKTPLGIEALQPLDGHPQLAADLIKFEGNARTLRLLANLQILADRNGLNLTAGTMSACMKYIAESYEADKEHDDHAFSKPGVCGTELAIVKLIQEATGTGKARNPIAFIVEAADDCVYSICDIEDGIRKRAISFDYLCEKLKEKEFGYIATDVVNSVDNKLSNCGLDEFKSSRGESYSVQFRVKAQGIAIKTAADAFIQNYDEIMAGTFTGELLSESGSTEGEKLIAFSKNLGRSDVYTVRSTIELELRGCRIIHDLLSALWPGVKNYEGESPKAKNADGKAWELLSKNYRDVFEHDWKNPPVNVDKVAWRHYLKLMLITDYVAGMTDGYAASLHKSLMNA